MFGYIYCTACGAGFDAYEFSLPNGLCDRCAELSDLEPVAEDEHDMRFCIRPASGDMCSECERLAEEEAEESDEDNMDVERSEEYDLRAASLYFGRLLT